VLHDIDEMRLRTSEIVGHKIIETLGVNGKIEATTDRRAALVNADYVITMFQVGGYKPSTVIDFEIPKKFGLEQTIADTLGIGGIMRGLRTIPVILDICKDMEELCPQAVLLNYVVLGRIASIEHHNDWSVSQRAAHGPPVSNRFVY
jgi:alpha-galactosidase